MMLHCLSLYDNLARGTMPSNVPRIHHGPFTVDIGDKKYLELILVVETLHY